MDDRLALSLHLDSCLEWNQSFWSWDQTVDDFTLTFPTELEFGFPTESSPVQLQYGTTSSASLSASQQRACASEISGYCSLGSSNQPPSASEHLRDEIAPATSDSQPSPLQTIRSPSRRRYTSERWEDVRPIIQDLYIYQGLSLNKTMETMKEVHGFMASYISQNRRDKVVAY